MWGWQRVEVKPFQLPVLQVCRQLERTRTGWSGMQGPLGVLPSEGRLVTRRFPAGDTVPCLLLHFPFRFFFSLCSFSCIHACIALEYCTSPRTSIAETPPGQPKEIPAGCLKAPPPPCSALSVSLTKSTSSGAWRCVGNSVKWHSARRATTRSEQATNSDPHCCSE